MTHPLPPPPTSYTTPSSTPPSTAKPTASTRGQWQLGTRFCPISEPTSEKRCVPGRRSLSWSWPASWFRLALVISPFGFGSRFWSDRLGSSRLCFFRWPGVRVRAFDWDEGQPPRRPPARLPFPLSTGGVLLRLQHFLLHVAGCCRHPRLLPLAARLLRGGAGVGCPARAQPRPPNTIQHPTL
eukprot:scaffold25189_cov79-Isochrysis_galbana.AAC.2